MSPATLRSLRIQLAGQRQQALEKSRQRLMLSILLFIAVGVVIGLRLFDLAVLQAVRRGPATDIMATLRPARADLVDRNGEVLATTLKVRGLAVRPDKLISNPEQLAHRIVTILPDLDLAFVKGQLTARAKFRYLKRRLTPEQVASINALGEPGLELQEEPERIYPNGKLASHVLGYVDIDGQGMSGVERGFNQRLLSEATLDKPVQLALDVRVQHALEYELATAMAKFEAIGAAGVVMDVHTGEVIALASLPTYDPNAISLSSTDTLFNRATLGTYELGSTFKTFTVAMALESGVSRISDKYDATVPLKVAGFLIHDDHPKKRWLTVPEVFIYSSNIGTARMAELIGADAQRAYLKKLGMLDPIALELPETARPQVPKIWGKLATMTVGYGHGIAVTPLHLATALSALVNGGTLHAPTLLKRPLDKPILGEKVFSQQTSDTMRALMRMVALDGTGKNADAAGYRIGGKTGTAEKPGIGGYRKKALISTFAGAFPMDNPRYVVIATLDEPKGNKETYGYATAGWVSAPIVKSVVQRIGPFLGIEPSLDHDLNVKPYESYVLEKQDKPD